MITWAGRIMVAYGGRPHPRALTVPGAASHADAWFSGELWADDLADMSEANSAYTLVDAVIMPATPWPIFLAAMVLLLVGIRRSGRDELSHIVARDESGGAA